MSAHTDNAIALWVMEQGNPDTLLPQNLPEEIFALAQEEIEAFKERPEEENVVEGLVALVMGIQAHQGETQTTHEAISENLQLYIQMLSIEKLRRMGFVTSYDAPDLDSVFDPSREMDVALNETLSALLPPEFLDALRR